MAQQIRPSEPAKLGESPGSGLSLKFLLLIVFICLIAWLIIVVHLDYESMWSDEWFSWMYALQGPFALVRATAQDVHPPLYYQLLWAWITITGSQSLFVMRLTAAFPALLTVALIYRLAYEWFRRRWTAIAAAAFLGTSGIFVYYARELRMYALTVLLATLSWWFLTRFLNGRSKSLLGYVASVALMAYTYYFSAFVLFAQVVVVAWFYRDKLKRLLWAYAAVFIAFLPWIPTVVDQMIVERARTGNLNAPLLGKYGATSPTTLANIGTFIETYTARQPAFVLLLLTLGFALGWRLLRARVQPWVAAAALWLFLTSALMFTINLVFPIYNLRYLLPIIPALALLAGLGASLLSDRRLVAALVGVIIISGALFHADAFLPEKAPHKDMLRTIAAEYRPGDRIWYNFSYGGLGSSLREEVAYHLQFDAPSLNSDEFVWDAPNDYADVSAVPRVWDVRPYWIPIPEQAAAPLTDERALSEDYVFGAYTVRLYEAPPMDEPPVQFGNLFQMLPAGVHKTSYRPGDTVIVKTWWQTTSLPTLDYSYVLELGSAADPLVKQNAGLVADTIPTSQWTPDQPYRLSQISFDLPDDLMPGDYPVLLGVYYWEDPQPLPNMASVDMSFEGHYRARIGTVHVVR